MARLLFSKKPFDSCFSNRVLRTWLQVRLKKHCVLLSFRPMAENPGRPPSGWWLTPVCPPFRLPDRDLSSLKNWSSILFLHDFTLKVCPGIAEALLTGLFVQEFYGIKGKLLIIL